MICNDGEVKKTLQISTFVLQWWVSKNFLKLLSHVKVFFRAFVYIDNLQLDRILEKENSILQWKVIQFLVTILSVTSSWIIKIVYMHSNQLITDLLVHAIKIVNVPTPPERLTFSSKERFGNPYNMQILEKWHASPIFWMVLYVPNLQ